ncbi:hypothetical protein FJT64_016785 [Amphibalanus amphitrite]|uniref:Uncharacterized protein n=1 Tax=Amphibalanus amphitrite TaxID=1232801 RepID=A0A6A4XDC0_AMPAM|nr:hypothetical protein FJT64_016785 [Amphibalanus amphitrite]
MNGALATETLASFLTPSFKKLSRIHDLDVGLIINDLGHWEDSSYQTAARVVRELRVVNDFTRRGCVGAFSMALSLAVSPLTIAICRRKSTRLTAVLGGLVAALGCLFTSFASQFHQLFFSYCTVIGQKVRFSDSP